MLNDQFASFVGLIPAPLCYGMTPGETALWLKKTLKLKLELQIAKMRNYRRECFSRHDWPRWIPPSPAMLSWESAWCYAATVFTEAIPSVDCGRSSGLPFQVFGAEWMTSDSVCKHLSGRELPGVSFHPHPFRQHINGDLRVLDGVRLNITQPDEFLPARTGIEIISCLQRLYGKKKIWQAAGVRPGFFDKLYGTDRARMALTEGMDPLEIAGEWKADQKHFIQARKDCLLYGQKR
jgi:uncharacterized protein YbbC (DUF1343 family)